MSKNPVSWEVGGLGMYLTMIFQTSAKGEKTIVYILSNILHVVKSKMLFIFSVSVSLFPF